MITSWIILLAFVQAVEADGSAPTVGIFKGSNQKFLIPGTAIGNNAYTYKCAGQAKEVPKCIVKRNFNLANWNHYLNYCCQILNCDNNCHTYTNQIYNKATHKLVAGEVLKNVIIEKNPKAGEAPFVAHFTTCVKCDDSLIDQLTWQSNELYVVVASLPATQLCPEFKVPHGRVSLSRNDILIASVQCEDGFHLYGTPTLECGTDGNWNDSAPFCESCAKFPVTNGNAVYSKRDTDGVLIASIQCKNTFFVPVAAELECEPSGRWNDDIPACKSYSSKCSSINDCPSGSLCTDDNHPAGSGFRGKYCFASCKTSEHCNAPTTCRKGFCYCAPVMGACSRAGDCCSNNCNFSFGQCDGRPDTDQCTSDIECDWIEYTAADKGSGTYLDCVDGECTGDPFFF